jgi:hypothetical protein
MEIFQSAAVAKIIFILGIVNILTAFFIFGSCRCVSGSKINRRITKARWYKHIFNLHCHIWKVFWPSVIIHAFLAIMYFGWPG